MTSKLLLLLSLLSVYIMEAQLTLTPGARFSVFSDTKLTFQNTDLINNGDLLLATTSPVSFTGNASSFIGGDQAVRFFKLEIDKSVNQSVSLQKTIGVGSGVFFISGYLNLNGFDLNLETTGHLDGEREESRIIGPNGGNVIFSINLNNPTGSNPANLGLLITSNQNLGDVVIKRGHQSQITIPGSGGSVFRYYDIFPDNNTNLDATLRFKYFDGELNGQNENSLNFFESQNAVNWTNLGSTSKDIVTNFIEKTGISSFRRVTLSNANNPLQVNFISFNANCGNGKVMLIWKTAQEQNSSRFDIEKSNDGIHWLVIGSLAAAGNSSIEKTYSSADNTPGQNNYYRIAEYDLDRRVQYTNVLQSSCSKAEKFTVWPNPSHDVVFINMNVATETSVIFKLFDSKGALVKIQRAGLQTGLNQLRLDMGSLANGIYSLSAIWNNGQTNRTLQVIKQ